MRNLTQYPITKEEKLRALDWAIQQAHGTKADGSGLLMGDTKGAALREIRKDVEREGGA